MSTVTKAELLGVLAVVVSAVAGLWLSGGRAEIYSVSVTIDAPPEAVFPYLVEPDLLRGWITGLVETKPLTEGGPRAGARSTEIIERDGRRSEMETEIVEFEPNRHIEVHIVSDVMVADSDYTLTAADGKTRLTEIFIPRFVGWGRLFSLFVRGAIDQDLRTDLDRLKAAVESGSG